MVWRVARSLDTLLGQLNVWAPRRSRASDGAIGDTAHQNRSSDHNPWYGPGIVTARDFTHDPAGGLDCQWLAGVLAASKDPRIKYVIWNRQILSGAPGPSPWIWRGYFGANPHTKHLHLSVVASPACDSTELWQGIAVNPRPPVPRSPGDDVNLEDKLHRYIWPFSPDIPDTVGSALANTQMYARGAFERTGVIVDTLSKVVAEVTSNPDITEARIKELMDQAVRENTPAPVQIDVDEQQLAVGVAAELHKRGIRGVSADEVRDIIGSLRVSVGPATQEGSSDGKTE